MTRKRYFTGSRFEERGGYARGVRDGDMVFMSGCVGFDYEKDTIADDIVEQTHQAFETSTADLRGWVHPLKMLFAS